MTEVTKNIQDTDAWKEVEYSWGRIGDDLFDRVMSKSEVEASSGKTH